MAIQRDTLQKVWRLLSKSDLSSDEQAVFAELFEILSAGLQEKSGANRQELSADRQAAVDTRPLLDVIQQQMAELNTMRRLSSKLTSSLDLSSVLDAVVSEAIQLLRGARNIHIFLYDNDEDRLEFGTALEATGIARQMTAPPRQDGLTYTAARKGEIIVVEDMRNHPLYRNTPKDWTGSIIAIPLKVEDKVVGVMNLSRTATGPFSESELSLLKLLADQAAIAISNARLHASLSRQVYTDTITGLPNRRALDERLEKDILKARREGQTFVVIMMDLDNFKEINDTYGHTVGDQVLRVTFNFLAQSLRSSDFLARYGGDELSLIMTQADIPAALLVAQKIQDALSTFRVQLPDGKRTKIGLSGGIAMYPNHARAAADLLRAADEALYRAKKTQRGTFSVARGFTGPLPYSPPTGR